MRLELTLAALERLIGGDTEIEVGLRQQIVEEFARKRLKTLINDAALKEIHAIWQAEAAKAVSAAVADTIEKEEAQSVYFDVRWRLGDKAKQAVRDYLDEAVEEIIQKKTLPTFDAYLQRQVGYVVRTMTEAAVTKMLPDAISAAIDGKLSELVEAEIQRRLSAAAKMP